MLFGGLAVAGGTALVLAPDVSGLTKVGGYGAMLAGGDTFVNGAGQFWSRSGGVSPIREVAGLYGRTVSGPEGEAQARYWMGWSLFLFDVAGGLGTTKIGTVPLRQLPTATKAALQDVYLLIRDKSKDTISQLEGLSFAKVNAYYSFDAAKFADDNSDILKFGEKAAGIHGPDVWDLKGVRIVDGKLKIGETVRGNILHRYFGENLPHTFKTFDRFVDGVATSIKTVDIHGKTAQDLDLLQNKLKGFIDEIVAFSEDAMFSQGKFYKVTAEDIEKRVLHLIIPYGSSNAQRRALQEVKIYAESQGVIFKLSEFF